MSSKFGIAKPIGGHQSPDAQNDTNREPLPKPTGKPPYRLSLAEVAERPLSNTKMVFHSIGDSGGIDNASPQQSVAQKLLEQFQNAAGDDIPAFLYHLGDVVYFNGSWNLYYQQYFNVYEGYLAPVFAIAGNHDGLPVTQSAADKKTSGIGTFVKVFCDSEARQLTVPAGGQVSRYSMIQPNVYWTLQTPLANFIGLYTNVSESQGYVDDNQKNWLICELKNAQTERSSKAIIVCLHHPPYSVDNDHGASESMASMLNSAYVSAGVTPDLVMSGHVHDYQRFTVNNANGSQLPYLVCGNAGYHNLSLVEKNAVPVATKTTVPGYPANITFENYCDDHWGFLRFTIENKGGQRTITAEYFNAPLPSENIKNPPVRKDYFQVDLNTNKVINLTP